MIFPKSIKSLEITLEELLRGPANVADLRVRLSKKGLNISPSGLYKQLGILRDSDIIVKRAGRYEVSNEWRDRVSRTLTRTGVGGLNEGEQIAHTLNSVADTDILWKQYVFDIVDPNRLQELYFYESHQFWIYEPERAESELDFINFTKHYGINVYHTIGYNTPNDKAFAKLAQGDTYQVNFEHLQRFSDSSHISVIGDIIIDTKTNKKLATEIHKAYKETNTTDELSERIHTLLKTPQRCTFTIERNAKKAAELKRRLGRNFVKKKS